MAFALGIDVGGTKIAAGVVDLQTGEMHHHRRIPAPRDVPAADSLAVVARLAREAVEKAHRDETRVTRVGLGVPECVSLEGVLQSAYTYAWTNAAVAQALADIGPVTIASDVQAAALAEATHGAGRGHPSCLYVSLGTGVSHSFTIDGRVHRGATGNAILFGCSPLRHRCAACGEEDERVLEHRGAGPALVRRFVAVGGEATTAEAVIEAEAAGDPRAASVLADAGAEVGQAVGHLINVLDPHIVVVGGGLGSSVDGAYWRAFEAEARRVPWSAPMQAVPIVRAGFGPHSGVVGAALWT